MFFTRRDCYKQVIIRKCDIDTIYNYYNDSILTTCSSGLLDQCYPLRGATVFTQVSIDYAIVLFIGKGTGQDAI